MKRKITLKIIKICGVILFALFSSAEAGNLKDNSISEFRPVDPNQISDILTMISNRVRSNYDRIKTWQGEVAVISDSIFEGAAAERIFKTNTDGKGECPKTINDHREHVIKFSLDAEKDFLHANYCPTIPLQYIDVENERGLTAKGTAAFRRAIVTPEYEFHCTGDTMRDGVVMSRKAVKHVRQKGRACKKTTPPVFNPKEQFLPGRPVWEEFPLTLQYINERGPLDVDGHTLKVEKRTDGNNTEYRVQMPGKISPTDYIIMDKIFSVEKGFNIILLEARMSNGQLFQKSTWDYEVIDGVYLLSRTTKQDFTPDAKLSSERKCVFKNSQVNQPIPAETFTYKNLGLKENDVFKDEIEKKEYRYKESTKTLEPIDKK